MNPQLDTSISLLLEHMSTSETVKIINIYNKTFSCAARASFLSPRVFCCSWNYGSWLIWFTPPLRSSLSRLYVPGRDFFRCWRREKERERGFVELFKGSQNLKYVAPTPRLWRFVSFEDFLDLISLGRTKSFCRWSVFENILLFIFLNNFSCFSILHLLNLTSCKSFVFTSRSFLLRMFL